MKIDSKTKLIKHILRTGFNKRGKIQPSEILNLIPDIKSFLPNIDSTASSELAYCLINDISNTPKCKICGGTIKFISYRRGYQTYCSKKCSASDPHKIQKSKETNKKTCLVKYGVDSFTKTNQFKSKTKKTCLERYGVEHYGGSTDCAVKTKQTKLARYGDEKFVNIEKMKNTKLQAYGDAFYTNRPKFKKTIQERYGVDHNFKIPGVRNKIITECFTKYGVPYFTQVPQFKEQIKNTCMERYGTTTFINDQCHSKVADDLFRSLYWTLPDELQTSSYTSSINREFHKYDSINRRNSFYDFVNIAKKICIEFQGDFWHMNPNKYTPNDFNVVTGLTAQEHWYNDLDKKNTMELNGYLVLYIWESDYASKDINDVVNGLRDLIINR